jgi:hypothetical protein
VGTRREKAGIGWKERKEGSKCTMWRERERETIEHMWNKCSELREREGENGKGRNSEERRKDKMDERDK